MQNSASVLSQLQSYQAGRRKPQDILGETETRLGLPSARQRLMGLRSAIGNTENLLRSVEPSVAGRTSGSLVTDAQRTKLVTNEREPIAEQFREQSRALEGEQGNLSDLSQRSLAEAQLGLSADDAKESGLRSLYGSLYQREQDEVARAERERAFNEQMRQFNEQQASASRATSAQGAYMEWLKNQGGSPGASEQSVPTQSVDDMDATYIGRLRNSGLGIDQVQRIVESLKRGNDQARRRYALGVKLGYWN